MRCVNDEALDAVNVCVATAFLAEIRSTSLRFEKGFESNSTGRALIRAEGQILAFPTCKQLVFEIRIRMFERTSERSV